MPRGLMTGWNAEVCLDLPPFPTPPREAEAGPVTGIGAIFPFLAAFSRQKSGFPLCRKML
ncbi:MAG: hypothetical protein CL533_18440 [Afipia sp.]|nr:hypothetical protein [Afipia sp.]OUX59722.1 MAG: hypothetical protein CBB64_18395 [Afipia sp. TMED4]HAP48279.1 hypothetical protein [Afipia sp.]HCX16625.1 hypothetical protein [Afipia sp.]|tara:strand:+ start:268 stop:447 length:180 start_codon:yes stop_codon:yes gene_type:complete